MFTNAVQKYVIENSRLGIPVTFHEEALHGLVSPGATSFPQAIALAGTWDLDCIEYEPDGSSTTRPGEWHFGYALGGHATTDVWILPGAEHGVSVRFPDPTAGEEGWVAVELAPVAPLKKPVTLAQIKAEAVLKDIALVRQGRLSVQPLKPAEFSRIRKIGGS